MGFNFLKSSDRCNKFHHVQDMEGRRGTISMNNVTQFDGRPLFSTMMHAKCA